MKKETRLYNILFPIWFLLLYPVSWIGVLPVNFGVDLLVLWLCFRHWKLPFREVWKKEIWLCWIFGFLGDIVGCTLLLAANFIPDEWWYNRIVEPLSTQPYSSVWAVLLILAAMAVASLCIYLLDRFVAFRRRGRALAHKMALTFAIATTPVTLLIPSVWLYRFM